MTDPTAVATAWMDRAWDAEVGPLWPPPEGAVEWVDYAPPTGTMTLDLT